MLPVVPCRCHQAGFCL